MNTLVPSLLAQQGPPPFMEFVDRLARTNLSTLVIFIAVLTAIRWVVVPILLKTPKHMRSGSYSVLKFVNETADALVYAGGLVFLLIRPFVLQTFFVPSESMVKTLLVNDVLVGNKFIYRRQDPVPGEIIVFRPPERAKEPGEGDKYFIKRLIGAPGDLVEVKDGKLYRNGKLEPEPFAQFIAREGFTKEGQNGFDFKLVKDGENYVPVITDPYGNINQQSRGEYLATDMIRAMDLSHLPAAKIPPGYYLFMGDNRNGSLDGRMWGLVPRREIIARADFILAPFSRWRGLPAHKFEN